MWKTIALAFVFLLFVSGCGNSVPKIKDTPTGNPEAYYPNEVLDTVKGKIIGKCAENNWIVSNVTPNTVTCTALSDSGTDVLVQLAFGTGSTRQVILNFILYSNESGTKVTVQGHQEITQSFGRKQVTKLEANEHFNRLQQILNDIGGQ